MEDWDADLVDAIPAAEKAAATPVTRAMLDICSRDMELPFSGSPKAMARLLDIAILTYEETAAVNLATRCRLRPLRRWALNWDLCWEFADCWVAARTALWAGADFQDLMVKASPSACEEVPFPQALFLESKLEVWQGVRHLLPRCHSLWTPKNWENRLARFFIGHRSIGKFPSSANRKKLPLDKIRSAEDAGVDLQFFSVGALCRGDADRLAFVTLMDLAIWCGQPDCAEACVDRDIELRGDDRTLAWHKRVLQGESLSLSHPHPSLDVVPSEAQTAAAAASCAGLKRLWKRESSQKGIVLYQMMVKMFKGRSFPMALVQEIMTFSMPVPKIIDQLDLWEHVGEWLASICCGPFAAAAADVDGMDVQAESARVDGPCASDELQLCTTTSAVGSWIVCKYSIRNSSRKTTSISHYLRKKGFFM